MQGVTSTAGSLESFSKTCEYGLPAKPRPGVRPALQSVSTTSPVHMPNSIPSALAPFPGITKNMQTSSGFAQATSYMQQTYRGSGAPENAIPAQHALCLMHASSYSSHLAQDSMQPYTTALSHQTDMNSDNGVQGRSQQASNWAFDRGIAANSPSSVMPEGENLMVGLTPQNIISSQSRTAQESASTGGKSDNTYVSFDEWRAQVHAKLISTPSNNHASEGSVGLPHGVHDQQPLSWLSSALVSGGAHNAPDHQHDN